MSGTSIIAQYSMPLNKTAQIDVKCTHKIYIKIHKLQCSMAC